MVNDSSFSFDSTLRPSGVGFCLSFTVVIWVWERGLTAKCVGVHVSCHICAVVQQDSEFCLWNLFWIAVFTVHWPQENVKHLFLFSLLFLFLRKCSAGWFWHHYCASPIANVHYTNYAVGRDGVSIVAALTTNTWELVADLHHKILENKSQKMNDEKNVDFLQKEVEHFQHP